MYRELLGAIKNIFGRKEIYFVIEGGKWSIDHDGYSITRNLEKVSSATTTTLLGIRNSVVHYGSINTFFRSGRLALPHISNKIVVTWFHINPGDPRIELIPEALKFVDVWHTSCAITRGKLIKFGVPENKIATIPLGVDLGLFYKPDRDQKTEIRSRFGIKHNDIVIGSFQKDGHGWGAGDDPKEIKGPDILCDVIEKLSDHCNLFVLLTGPARGYVKKRLKRANVKYLHHFLSSPDDTAEYYRAIDLYIVTSREEGGPKAILESLASGVPLVTTRVGMGPDMIQDGENGFLCDVEDVEEITEKSLMMIQNTEIKSQFVDKGLDVIRDYDWKLIARRYEHLLYRPLL